MVTLIRASGGGILGTLAAAASPGEAAFVYPDDETGVVAETSSYSKKGNVGRAARAMSLTHARVYTDGATAGEIVVAAVNSAANDAITSIKGTKAISTSADAWTEVAFDTPISIAAGEDFAILYNRTDGAGTDSAGLYQKTAETRFRNRFLNWTRGFRNNNAGSLAETDINELALNSGGYAIQYRGNFTSLATPSSFLLATAVSGPIGTNVSIAGFGQGANTDGEGGFVAPFDMTLKGFTEGNQRTGGYRTDTEYFIGVNGTFTSLTGGPVAATTENYRTYTPNIAIKAGDYVELTYTCGNNFSMNMTAAYYFEKDGADSNGYGVLWYSGTPSDNTTYEMGVAGDTDISWYDVAIPQAMTVKGIVVNPVDEPHAGFLDMHLFKNAVDQNIDYTLPGEQEYGYKGGLSVSFAAGDLIKLQALCSVHAAPYVTAGLLYTIDGKTEADKNIHTLWMSDDTAQVADNWWGPWRMPCDGRITRGNLIVPFGYTGKSVYVSKNGAAATELFSVVDALDDIPYEAGLDYSFSAGDTLDFSHDGHGTSGAGLGLTVEIELDKTTELSNLPVAPVNTPSIASFDTISEDNAVRVTTGQISNVPKPTGVTVGDLMWLVCASSDVNGTNNWTTPTGWKIMAHVGGPSADSEFTIFSRIADGTEPATLDIAYNDDAEAATVVWIRFSNARGLEAWTGGVEDSSGTAGVLPDWNTKTNNALVLAIVVCDSAEGMPSTIDNGFTELVDISNPDSLDTAGVGLSISYKTVATAGAVGETNWVLGSTQGKAMCGFAIQGT